jgi:hypothetical protein
MPPYLLAVPTTVPCYVHVLDEHHLKSDLVKVTQDLNRLMYYELDGPASDL